MKLLPILLSAGMSLSPTFAQAQSQASAELYDYLVQDVCINDQGEAIAGDPAVCPKTRNIKVGEPSPYIVTDWDTANSVSYTAWNSIPVQGEDGNVRVMVSKSLETLFDEDYSFSFRPARDGFDLIDLSFGSYASVIRTSDGGCLDQLFSPRLARNLRSGTRFNRRRPHSLAMLHSPQTRAGGWILFPFELAPSQWPQTSSLVHRNVRTPLQPESGCNTGGSRGVTYWNAPADYAFERNEDGVRKTLRAIRSDHFGKRNLSSRSNALERFYFTREYGMTRWEAWIPRRRCVARAERAPQGSLRSQCFPEAGEPASGDYPELPLRDRCQDLNGTDTGHPDVARWGDQDWVRVDCRDMTRYVELRQPVLMLDRNMAQINGVDDIDF
ncbi:MAG: hypothetical protein AAFY42_02430 [Pseudomonadota bacterium]